MGGHLPDHRDLEHTHSTVLGYALDSIWVGGFALSVLMAFRSGITFRYAFIFALGVALLVVTNPVGLGDILGWRVHAALCLFALACLKGWID